VSAHAARRQERERWDARRRWSRAGFAYLLLIFFSILFLGPLLFAALSSVKTDPLAYPPTLLSPQLSPANWATAAKLGREGANAPLWGGFAPGADVNVDVTYFVPEGTVAAAPTATVPRRRPGGGLGAVQQILYAADHAVVAPVVEVGRRQGVHGPEGATGEFVTYRVNVTYEGEGPKIDRLPLDVEAPSRKQEFVSSTLPPTRLERLGLVASFQAVTPGALGYLLGNYRRVFTEARSITTGNSLFLRWTWNTLVYAFFRVIVALFIATTAGYALARLHFRGRNLVFMLVLFAQMVPLQVLFISNYLVLRDGIWGLSSLWGQTTLLNGLPGLLFVTALNAGPVFIMKQFFESIPREVEESAMIDGASYWSRFSRVVLPMARPALGALVILSFQGAWNDFFWPLVVLTTPEDIKTLPIGLLTFRNVYGNSGDWGLILAGAILSALPVIVLFVVFQRYFMEGVSYGGGKE
jgi:multiple sugar transport system permease protein